MAIKSARGKAAQSTGRTRSAISGRYVTKPYAKAHPKTTVKESLRRKKK